LKTHFGIISLRVVKRGMVRELVRLFCVRQVASRVTARLGHCQSPNPRVSPTQTLQGSTKSAQLKKKSVERARRGRVRESEMDSEMKRFEKRPT